MARKHFSIARIGETPQVLELIRADGDALEGNLEPKQADILEACEEFKDQVLRILGGEQARVKLVVWCSGTGERDYLDFQFGLERDRRN